MDIHLRLLLRDHNSTPKQCYYALKRAGFSIYAIGKELEEYKIPASQANQNYYNFLLQIAEISLNEARRKVADNLFEDYDFEYSVVDFNGWTWYEDSLDRVVFLQTNELGDSIRVNFSIDFQPNTALVEYYGT